MMKRILLGFLMALLLAQSAFTSNATAAVVFTDTSGHWAEQQINELARLGILKENGYQPFYPNKPVSRGEALALMNRVFESVYGPVAKPERKNNLDYRYLLRSETEQLLANMRTMLQIETGIVSHYDPGDRMLYYLYLADNYKLMKKQEKENLDWWLSTASLQRPLSREEASLLLFHMMTPQKFRTANIKPQDAAAYFTSFYEWKQDTFYRDTYSPYALAIREFNLFASEKTFQPEKLMSRAEYAVVMKRLHDYFIKDATGQFKASGAHQQRIAQVYLRAATLAFESNNQARLSRFFTPTALMTMSKLAHKPKFTEHLNLTVKADENDSNKLWVIGQYQDSINGVYQLEYLFEPDASNAYGRKITRMIYTEK
ncbi:S-layer homology domain-containing protein [Brevibacillus sp. NRS-1366]|uniref:S-layer homology domain-containing protein n=1 Tax=Brevibacillus sp. NRS-1366 TaxID=3233899 RepID=UPI003D1A7444